MKRETKERIKAKAESAWRGFCECLPAIGLGIGSGMLLGGYFGALENSARVKKLEKKHEELRDEFDEHRAWVNNEVVDKHNSLARFAHREIDNLKNENRTLMERALRETEGK